MKGCSLDLNELKAWTFEQIETEPKYCQHCSPDHDDERSTHLTRLDRDILTFVLEIATSHLDEIDYAYGLTVSMIARCFGKTEAQLTSALLRLVDGELLTISGKIDPQTALPFNSHVTPTSTALRTLPHYAEFNNRQMALELKKLEPAAV